MAGSDYQPEEWEGSLAQRGVPHEEIEMRRIGRALLLQKKNNAICAIERLTVLTVLALMGDTLDDAKEAVDEVPELQVPDDFSLDEAIKQWEEEFRRAARFICGVDATDTFGFEEMA